jgi:hypothetical protein
MKFVANEQRNWPNLEARNHTPQMMQPLALLIIRQQEHL